MYDSQLKTNLQPFFSMMATLPQQLRLFYFNGRGVYANKRPMGHIAHLRNDSNSLNKFALSHAIYHNIDSEKKKPVVSFCELNGTFL